MCGLREASATRFYPLPILWPKTGDNNLKSSTWTSLIAHNHWIRLDCRGGSLRLCARCTGLIIGFVSLLGVMSFLDLKFFFYLSLPNQMIVCFLFAVPAIWDWTTQSWRLRSSTNMIRIVTGFCEGVGIWLLTVVAMPFLYKFSMVLLITGSIVTLVIVGRKYILSTHPERAKCCLSTGLK